MSKDDETCKHCGREIYYWVNGWLPNARGNWYHYHSDKEHCSYPYESYAEPITTTKRRPLMSLTGTVKLTDC